MNGPRRDGRGGPPMRAQVVGKEWLTPDMIRIRLGGPGLQSFSPKPATDQYVICLFAPDGAPYQVPFGPEAEAAPPALRPRSRRLTVRTWDATTGVLTLDIVAHGDVGFAGRWAQRAEIGDELHLRGPGGDYSPDPAADWYLFGGDESALPAIAASLEVLPPGRPCVVLAVVDSSDHHLELDSPADLHVRWLHRVTAADPEALLAQAITALDWRPGAVDVFVHGEAAEVRAARRHLIGDRGIDRQAASISPYWRRDHDDEQWRAVKRAWLAEQEADA